MDARLIAFARGHAGWNMAIDESLLRSTPERQGTLRFYGWEPAALSLGYFQKLADRNQHAASQQLTLVRRASGGGAIVHDRELTYSIALPNQNRFGGAAELVQRVHRSLAETLQAWGVRPSLWSGPPTDASQEPFLCFQRRAEGDLVVDGHKIAGSAQRRHRNAVLVHGSILLAQSPFAPELAGIGEITGKCISASDLAAKWATQLAIDFGWSLTSGKLASSEEAQAEELLNGRYGCQAWSARR